MSGRKRLVFVLTAPLVLVATGIVVQLVPGPRTCPSISCGSRFDSGAVDVFGSGNLTLAETLVLATGIWVAAWLLTRSVLPTRPLTSAGIATVVLAVAVALLLPSQVVAPEPSVACSSPDALGRPIAGNCASGPPAIDSRAGIRAIVLAAGLAVLGLATIGELAQRSRGAIRSI